MTKHTFDFSQAIASGSNPHDYFGRVTIGDPLIAGDLLLRYADAIIAKHVDLSNLQSEPTQFFGPTDPIRGPKEVKLDVPYIARLHDKQWKSEVLIVAEHKSTPNLYCPLQLGVYALLSLYKRWTDAGRPSSRRKLKLPIPIMVLLYCGEEDLPDGVICFQDIFEHIPDELKPLVPQFFLVVINLKKFHYDNLPGKPETQAVVETMKRAFDGTLAEHLPDVLGRLTTSPIDDRILDLIANIAWYSGRVTDIMPEKIVTAVTNVVKGKEGIEMAEMIKNSFIQEGIEIGEQKGKIKAILTFLRTKFHHVPDEIIGELYKRTDPTALESLVILAAQCKTLDEFAKALK
jgi:hypothetical protein